MNTKSFTLMLTLILAGLLLIGCTATNNQIEPTEPPVTADEPVGLANPASVYCTEQGGSLEIHTDEAGGQNGICLFDDGSECEEWAYFRGECAPGNTQLFDTVWNLQSYGDQSPIAGTTPTLTISRDWQLGGSAGCNSFFGSVTREGDTWQVGQMGSTMMACADTGVMEQETAVLTLLQSVTSHTMTSGTLTLHTPTGDLVYTPAPNTTLEGTRWTLNGLAQADTISTTWLDGEIYIQFVTGQVYGFGGCNRFAGNYEGKEDNLTLLPLMQTKMACDEEHNQRENEVMTALQQTASYHTELQTLSLLDASGNLLATFVASGPAE